MAYQARLISLIGNAMILSLCVQASAAAQTTSPQDAAAKAVRSFYTFHLARKKDFTVPNVRLRKRWLTPELYKLLLDELKREAEESKAHRTRRPISKGTR